MSLSLFQLHALLFVTCGCLIHLIHCDPELTAKDEFKLHRLFRRYNKPAVEEIKTIHGDVYSCVDFYKQPAFDHPLLKNHSYHYEMMSSSLHDHQPSAASNNVSQEISAFEDLWENGVGCPKGTIPLKKYTNDQFIKTHTLFQRLYPVDTPIPNRYRAAVHTLDGSRKFFGGTAKISVHNYPVDPTQYTAGYQIIRAGNDQFQYGWMINPEAFGDGETRSFLSTKVDQIKCFNLLCPGFVQVSSSLPLGHVITPTSKLGGPIFTIKPIMLRDSNVWKLYSQNREGVGIPIGYWPNEVLKGLAGAAEYIEWGGEAYNPNDLKGPGMGSGDPFPLFDFDRDAFIQNMEGFDETGKRFELLYKDTELFADDAKLYRAEDACSWTPIHGHTVFYGGTGRLSN